MAYRKALEQMEGLTSKKSSGKKQSNSAKHCWLLSLIPALGRQKQVDLSEFKARLFYKMSSRISKATKRNPVSENQKRKKEKKEKIDRQKDSKLRLISMK